MTEIPIHTNAAILALAIHGASTMGLTLDAAIISSPATLSAKLSAKLSALAYDRARIAQVTRTAQPEVEEEKPRVIDGIAAMRALAKQLKQS